jgi:hypothetical protein
VRRALFVVGVALLLMGQRGAPETIHRGWATTAEVALRIWLPTGTVEVECWELDSVDVRGTIGTHSSFFGGVAAGGASGKFGVEPRARGDARLASADLRVMMPRRAQLAIKMTDGRVMAVGTSGSLEVLTVTGDVTIRQARGSVTVETIDAKVRISETQGAVRVRNGGGVVTLADVQGSMTLTTVDGAITVEGTALGDGRLETIGGSIAVRGRLTPQARLELSSHDGPISLLLDPTAVPRLDLATRGGLVRNGLGLGNARFGEVVGRSFKGGINVAARSGIEGGKHSKKP